MKKQSIRSVVHPDDLERVLTYHQGRLQGKKAPSRYEFKGVSKDGSAIYLEADVVVLKEGKSLVGTRSYMWDITGRKQAEEDFQKRNTQLELVHHIQSEIPMNTDMETILIRAAESIGKSFGYYKVSVNLYDRETNEIEYVTGWNKSGLPLSPGHRQKLGQGLIGKAGLLKQTIVANDVSKEPDYLIYHLSETKAELIIPLLVQDQLIGVLDLQSPQVNAFSKEDVSVLQAIGNYIAYIIDGKQREEALRASEKRFRALIEHSSDVITLVGSDGTILYESPSAKRILGFPPEERLGKSAFEKIHPDDLPCIRNSFSQLLKHPEESTTVQARTRHGDGTWHWTEAIGSNLLAEPIVQAIVVNIRDITERKRAEDQIKASLAEKEVLLREIHHRVKNNMQIISSLLNLQTGYIQDEHTYKMIKNSQSRIRSMALVHEKLYKSQNLSQINLSEYVQSLASYLFQLNQSNPNLIQLKTNLEDIYLDIQTAIPCGLILNELITNALVHAFPKGQNGEIEIGLHPIEENTYEMTVRDNGVGIPRELDIHKTTTFGLQIVSTLIEQLDGKMEVQREGGTVFKIIFKELRYAPRL